MGVGLLYQQQLNPPLISYSGADFAGDRETRRSTSGVGIFMGSSLIHWISKQQSCTAQSTTEAEYIAAATAAKEVKWFRQLFIDLKMPQGKPTPLVVDNQSAIKVTYNPEFHQRSKHIEVKYHFIRETIEEGHIETQYVPTQEQKADMLTKP